MKTVLTAFFISATSLFAQNIHPISEGSVYDRAGRLIAYNYADGTRDLYAYDLQGRMASFIDRVRTKTYFFSSTDNGKTTLGHPAVSVNAPIDSMLFINYGTYSGNPNVAWSVCGSTQQTTGCYGAGTLGPFGKVAALIEGNPSTNSSTSTVTRFIYILDIATGPNLNGVILYVFRRTDVISPSTDNVNVTLAKTVSLPLVGGTAAAGFMAANTTSLFIGTNQSSPAVQVQKKGFTITTLDSGITNVSAITADPYGFITVTQGSFSGTPNYYVFDPSGSDVQDGGGPYSMLNTVQAALPSTFP
jgi:YD repeat-containing protein